jgi:branched-chain amino acid transport system ATP-binding protein
LHAWRQKKETINKVYELFPVLRERYNQLARTLSGGEQQMLAMARGLMAIPKMCVFDEPSYGLAPFLVKDIFGIIKELHQRGITILLIEQNVKHSLDVADRAYVLENGRVTIQDSCSELICNDYIRKAYLGL